MSATVVSIAPFKVSRSFPGCVPENFTVPAAEKGGIAILVVPDVRFSIYVDSDRPPVIQIQPAIKAAESVCHDFKMGQFLVSMGVEEPGLFAVDGDYSGKEKQIPTLLKAELEQATRAQTAWFKAHTNYADDLWQRYRRRSMISDLQVKAAEWLGLQREWIIDREIEAAAIKCPVCFNIVNPQAIVCGFCRAILRADAVKDIKFLDDVKK